VTIEIILLAILFLDHTLKMIPDLLSTFSYARSSQQLEITVKLPRPYLFSMSLLWTDEVISSTRMNLSLTKPSAAIHETTSSLLLLLVVKPSKYSMVLSLWVVKFSQRLTILQMHQFKNSPIVSQPVQHHVHYPLHYQAFIRLIQAEI